MSTIIVSDKKCKKCGGNEWLPRYRNRDGKIQRFKVCVACKNEYARKYRKSEMGKITHLRGANKARLALKDGYIICRLKYMGYDTSELTEEDIQTYREGLIISRKREQIIKKAMKLTEEEKKAKANAYQKQYYAEHSKEICLKRKKREAVLKNPKLMDKATLAVIAEESVVATHSPKISIAPALADVRPPLFIQMLNKLLKEKTSLLEKTQKEIEAIHVLLNI